MDSESPHGRCKRTKESSAFSWKEFTNLHWGVQFIVRRGASTVVRACDRREPSLKNFLKSSFVSDGLARPKAQRTGTLYGRIVADPAATSCSHRRILSRYMVLPWTAIPFRCPFTPEYTSLVVLVATRQIARESSALSSLAKRADVFADDHDASYLVVAIVSVTRSAV